MIDFDRFCALVEWGLIDLESVSCPSGSINMWCRPLGFQVGISLSGIHGPEKYSQTAPLLEVGPANPHMCQKPLLLCLPFLDTSCLMCPTNALPSFMYLNLPQQRCSNFQKVVASGESSLCLCSLPCLLSKSASSATDRNFLFLAGLNQAKVGDDDENDVGAKGK